jgi:membrane protease subunit HflK
MYLETVESVLGNATKVILDTDGSGNLIYLPVDKLLEQRGRSAGSSDALDTLLDTSDSTSGQGNDRQRDDARSRGAR